MPRNNPWKVHSRKKVLTTKIFNVFVEHSECPRTGKRSDFWTFKFGGWVNIVAITKNNEMVMIRQFRHGNKKWELEIPGGLIDKTDSNPLEAAQRELFEETGFKGRNPEIIGFVHPNPALQQNRCYTGFVDNAVEISAPPMEDTEDIETVLVPVEKLESMISKGRIRHGLVMNALQLYFLKKYKR